MDQGCSTTKSKRCHQIGRCCIFICYYQTVHNKGFKGVTRGGDFGRPAEAGKGGGEGAGSGRGEGEGGRLVLQGALLPPGAEIGSSVLVCLRLFAFFRDFEAQMARLIQI